MVKKTFLILPLFLFGSVVLLQPTVSCAETTTQKKSILFSKDKNAATQSSQIIYIEELPEKDVVQKSFLVFRGGSNSLNNLSLSNNYYQFNYPSQSKSLALNLGYEYVPINLLGHWGGFFDLGFSSHQAQILRPQGNADKVNLYLFLWTLGVAYQANFFHVLRWAMPTLSAGPSYHLYFQRSAIDELQTQGGIWAFTSTLGLRHSLEWTGFKKAHLNVDYRLTSNAFNNTVDVSGKTLYFGIASEI